MLYVLNVDDAFVSKLAKVTAEVMNLAALVRRGDDAAWGGIGPDAHIRAASELVAFADLAGRAGGSGGVADLAAAGLKARVLGEEIMRTGLPVSEQAQKLATELLHALGVGPEILDALDGEP